MDTSSTGTIELPGTAPGLDREDGTIPARYLEWNTSAGSRKYAFLCVLVLLTCSLIAHPVAEIGMNDDGPYVWSARVLALTGHIVYNGWATAMLGWQLILGALFIHVFGPSFTSVRASTLLVGLVTTFLFQRTLVRTGINTRNATLGTLALVLGPLFFPLALSFMSDMGGLFCIILCLYACLRALQAETDRATLAWLAFAAISNALGGTVRQIAWLGVLVMVPSTIWLLRRRRPIALAGSVLCCAGSIFIAGSLHWFSTQPYTVPEPLIPSQLDPHSLNQLVLGLLSAFFAFALFLLPFLSAFLPAISLRNKPMKDFLIVGAVLCLAAAVFLAVRHPHGQVYLYAPYKGNYLGQHGLVDGTPIVGKRPIILTPALRLVLSIAVVGVLNCFFAFLFLGRRRAHSSQELYDVSWNMLLVLLIPFSLAYFTLLIPRGLTGNLFDRYLLPLLPVALILLLRLFQDRVRPNLPWISTALILLFAVYTVAGTHDAFSMFRGRQAVFAELRSGGVPATRIDGGFEQNSLTQINTLGYMNDRRIRLPRPVYVPYVSPYPRDCHPLMEDLTPAVTPGYTLSLDPTACGGQSGFAPYSYRQWLGGATVSVYAVYTVKPASQN